MRSDSFHPALLPGDLCWCDLSVSATKLAKVNQPKGPKGRFEAPSRERRIVELQEGISKNGKEERKDAICMYALRLRTARGIVQLPMMDPERTTFLELLRHVCDGLGEGAPVPHCLMSRWG